VVPASRLARLKKNQKSQKKNGDPLSNMQEFGITEGGINDPF
jgi:hypothetical protein